MRAMFGVVLVAGVALAGSAVYLAKGYIGQTQNALQAERELRAKVGPVVQVYVANKVKNYGEPLLPDDVSLVYWPENSLPEGIFKDAKELFPEGANQDRFVMRQMEKFEPVMEVKVTKPGEPAGLTGKLSKGMRAFAIKVDVASGKSGFQPGDRVDIYWTGSVSSTSGELTRLIETAVDVIAVDQQDEKASGSMVARTITVATTPEQVARLAQGQATGRLALSLVGNADGQFSGDTIEINTSSLLNLQKEQVAQVEEKKVCQIYVNKGGEKVAVEIPCTN
jgi:pilus assembly protein CpaB